MTEETDDKISLLEAWDINIPKIPKVVLSKQVAGTYRNLRISDNKIYGIEKDGLISIWSLNVYDSLKSLGEVIGYDPRDVWLNGDHLFLIEKNAFVILDISDFNSPIKLSEYEIKAGQGITVFNDYAFLTKGCYGVEVLDISDFDNITTVKALEGFYWAGFSQIHDSTLYIGDGHHGIHALSLKGNDEFAKVGYYNTPGHVYDFVIQSGTCYIADVYELTVCSFDVDN